MRVLRLIIVLAWVQAGWPALAAAQEWDSARALELVARATQRRALAQGPGGLQRWEALARGMVLFLTQLGDDPSTPQLVKADDLAVEVYWEAPGRSKQTIVAWRDRAWLPNDLHYHRDHLGIVANDFGPLIRIGDGDEVRDAPHPLSPAGAGAYQFALVDSITVTSEARSWQVYTLRVRPLDPSAAAVIGTLFLDRASGALVRFQFSFTPASYREASIEDITVSLESALQAGGYWLPWRQEIEIRRQSSLVAFPIRGIIRGQWELGDFQVDDEVSPRSLAGASIGGLLAPGGDAGRFQSSLDERLHQAAGATSQLDLETLRHQIRAELGSGALLAQPPARPAIGSISDLARVNRVEGLRLGLGASLRPAGSVVIAPWIGVGLSNHRLSGRLDLGVQTGTGSTLRLVAEQEVQDVATGVVSPILNSLLAQEFGRDRGDWSEHRSVGLQWFRRGASGVDLRAGLGIEEWRPVPVAATPAWGTFRPNPSLSSDLHGVLRLGLSRGATAGPLPGLGWSLGAELGVGDDQYLRVEGEAGWQRSTDAGVLRVHWRGGWASADLPAPRGFVLGGWGTLPGTPFRAWGGRAMALGRIEWLGRIRLPEVALGSFPKVGSDLLLGPFVAAGVVGQPIDGTPWGHSGGIQPVLGIAMEGLFGLLRFELGRSLRGGGSGASGDIVSSWWIIL